MSARPILFSAPMVRALLAGRKTQTRRIVKSPHVADADRWAYSEMLGQWESGISGGGGVAAHGEYVSCPYGEPGDTLWVKETWRTAKDLDAKSPTAIAATCIDAGYRTPWAPLIYEADGARVNWQKWGVGGDDAEAGKVRVSIHMPRWASRITLRVASVRVERLQAIAEDDAKAEGVTPFPDDPEGDCWTNGKHRTAFEYLWNEINGWSPNAWQANPWVWVVGFEIDTSTARAVTADNL